MKNIANSQYTLPLHEQVYIHLKQSLMQGTLQPGQRLTLRSLADELGTSIAPIREAVSRLAALDALRVFPKRHILVPALTAEKYLEFIEVRKLLEGHATSRACERVSDENIAEVVALNENIQMYSKMGEMDQAMQENQKFHFAIYRGAESSVLIESIEQIWLRIGPSINQIIKQEFLRGDEALKLMFDLHVPLVEALIARDPTKALNAMIGVINTSADYLLAGLRRQSDTSTATLKAIAEL
jgi:DNA-binding GntR family transcriptional regulator